MWLQLTMARSQVAYLKVHDDDDVALISWLRVEDPSLEQAEQQVGRIIPDISQYMIGRIHALPGQ